MPMPMPIFKLGDGDGAAAAFLAVARPARPCSLRGPGRRTRLRRVLCARCAMAAGSRASCSRAAGAEDPHGWAGEFHGFQPGLPVTTRGGDPPREGGLVFCTVAAGVGVPDVCRTCVWCGGVSVRRAGRRCAARTCRDVAWLAVPQECLCLLGCRAPLHVPRLRFAHRVLGALGARPGRSLGPPRCSGSMGPRARPRRGGVVRSRLRLRTKVRDCRLSRRWRAAATYIYVLRRGLLSRRAVSGQPAPRERRLRRRAGRLQARASPRRGGSARRGGRTTTGGRLAGRGAPGCRPRQNACSQ